MKYRLDFVTNSSSSSYIISIPKNFQIKTKDKHLKDFIAVLSKDFEQLFEMLSYSNSDYGVKYYNCLEDIANELIDNAWEQYKKQLYRSLIFNDKTSIVNEKGLVTAIRDAEGEYYGKSESYVNFISEIKAGKKVVRLSTSHHNDLICQLMYLIMNSEGVVTLANCSG